MRSVDLDPIVQAGTLADRLTLLADYPNAGAHLLDTVLERAEELVHDRPADSWALAELGATAATDPDTRARASYLQARIAAERGQLDDALALIEAARADWAGAGEPVKALRTDLGRMQVLDDLGRHHEAIEVGTRLTAALHTMSEPEPEPDADADPTVGQTVVWLRATAHNNLGVAHSFLGDHVRASEQYRQAEEAYVAAGLHDDVAKTRANRGIELLVLGRAREALEVLLQAEAAFVDLEDRLWAAKCAGHVAQAYRQLGELVTALRILRDARSTLVELGAEVEAARLRSNIAEVYLAAGLFDEAHTEAAQAAEFLGSLQLSHDQAVATFTEAVAALESGRLVVAEQALDRASQLFDEVGDRHYSARVRQVNASLAVRAEDPDRARTLAGEAATELAAGGWTLGLAWTRLQQADLAETAAELDTHLAAAAELVRDLRLPALQFALALREARAQRERGESGRAQLSLLDAIALAERVGATLTSIEVRAAFRADHAAVYDELVDLLTGPDEVSASPDRSTAALLASHRSKSVTLSQALEGSLGRRASRVGTSVGDIDRARADLSALYHAMSRAEEAELAGRLRVQAVELEQQLTLLQLDADLGRAGAGSPISRSLDRRDPGVSAAPRTVLAFHLLSRDLVVFVDDGERVVHRRLPGVRAALERTLGRLRAHWNRFRIGPDFLDRHQILMARTCLDLLAELHRQLIDPVADLLAAASNGASDPTTGAVGELVVIAHRLLHQVPFAALHDGTDFLLQHWSVVMAPTATDPDRVPAAAAGDRLLAVGVPDEAATSISAELSELRAVRPDAEILLGEAATTKALRTALPGPAYVHVACHGLFRSANPMFSALRLHDRWLTAAELMEYDFGGALVTLGACETGRTEPAGAEATGMSWSLLTSGASGVIVSHWLIDDLATARFTPELYRNLAAGLPPAQALRQAQLAAATLGVHPFHWAAFSFVAVHGDPRIGVSP